MISVGIFNGYFPYTLDESIKRIKALGFTSVQLDLSFKEMDLSLKSLTKGKCHLIRDAFRDADLPVVAVSGYTNLVHPDLKKREENLNNLRTILKLARDLGSPYVVSETGTFNAESDWVYHEKNGTEEAYETLCGIVADLAKFAYDNGSIFLIENYVNNVIGTINQVLRLFSDVNHNSLGLLMDPTNYFSDVNIDDVDGELNRIFNALSDKIRIAHAKDCKRTENVEEKHADIDASESHSFRGAGSVELPAPGLGILNYDLYLKRLSALYPNIPLIIEHLDEDDIPRAKKFIDDKLKKAGC
jgi:sugar phosphate isomerase/epimerase